MILVLGERLLVDASVAIKWVIAELAHERAAALLDYDLMAPDLLFLECANILWRKVRLREINEAEAAAAAVALEAAELSVVAAKPYFRRALEIATELDHPAYDAVYLAVAEVSGIRMITADSRLLRKVRQSGSRFRAMLVPLSDIPPAGYSA